MKVWISLLVCVCFSLFISCAPGFPYTPSPGGGLPQPQPSPYSPAPSEEAAVNLAKEYLSAKLKITPDQITVVLIEKVDWPDTSLGLPEPDMAYAQVIVPGFKITLRALGQDYIYHAGVLGGNMVVRLASPKG